MGEKLDTKFYLGRAEQALTRLFHGAEFLGMTGLQSILTGIIMDIQEAKLAYDQTLRDSVR